MEKVKRIKKIGVFNNEILNSIIKTVEDIIKGKGEIIYADVIKFIIMDRYSGEQYYSILVWCNYDINLVKVFVEF